MEKQVLFSINVKIAEGKEKKILKRMTLLVQNHDDGHSIDDLTFWSLKCQNSDFTYVFMV